MRYFIKDGKKLAYQVIRKRNKHTYFRIKEGILYVTAHPLSTYQAIESFIDQKFDLFYQKSNESLTKENDQVIQLWGITYPLILEKGRFKVEIIDDKVCVKSLSEDIILIKKRIYHHVMEKALEETHSRIIPIIKTVGLSPIPIKIKYLKSKYGSYHRKHHEITMNSFLVRLDPIYLTYVLFHEYAHAKVFNHSKAFYEVLDHLMPGHKQYQKDLKKWTITE
ncbi:MAG: DUF45 domain-containing protein [Acholeplasma sp.]|jgi:predicted metal-dependent hydrolase|nr:MAG: DUF45 domain-containing protein [Acholeplasma sp.]